MKKKTISQFVIKKYFIFSFRLLVGVLILYALISLLSKNSIDNLMDGISAEKLAKADYENIDTSSLENLDGWIEILDDKNDVIYRKGKVQEEVHHYTQGELLKLSSIDRVTENQPYKIAGVIEIGIKKDKQEYYASATIFEKYGKDYTCLVKIPVEKLRIKYTIMNPGGKTKYDILKLTLFFFFGVAVVFLMGLISYSKSIQKHVAKPNKDLVDGLEKITSGDYSNRLTLNGEYEYKEIEEAFNFMVYELEKVKKERENLEKERQQLFSSIAHDLRTPITTIKGYTRALLDNLIDSHEKQEEYLNTIFRKADNMSELIDLLMVYTKMSNEEYKLNLEKVDFKEFILEIAAEYFNEFEKGNMNLDIITDENDVACVIDKLEMRRVVVNLLVNVIKHNKEGTSVKLVVKQENKKTIFEVHDNGGPIKNEIIDKIFDPFVSGDESRTSKNGNGLGLSICKKIVEKHGRSIKLIMIDDRWKCFRVEI
jgi:signal transduction histidine kinase